jgi:hypothetical protein
MDEDGGGDRQRHFNPRQSNIIICDDDPNASLVGEAKLSPEGIRGLGDDGLAETILLFDPGGLLNYLRDHAVSADQLREAAEEARSAEKYRSQISRPTGPCGTNRGRWLRVE